MSDFLINLARRGAGLPAGQGNARPPVRDNQALSENFELDQMVETSEPPAFESGSQPTSETTPARRAPTLAMSEVQEPQQPQPSRAPQAPEMVSAPETVLTPAPAGSIQRSPEAVSHTANPLSEPRSESPAPSLVEQNNASEARPNSPTVVRQFPHSIKETPSSSAGPAQPLTESVLVARPRSSSNEPMIKSPVSQEPSRAMVADADKAIQIVSVTESDEPSKGERQRERDRLGVVTLTPRSPVNEDQQLTKLADVVPAAAAEVASMPVHVRIAKIEVRAAPVPAPPSAVTVGPAPIGFDSYYRLRTYRS